MFQPLLEPLLKNSARRSLKRGDVIYHQGDMPESVFLVETGLVGLFHVNESGKETFLRVFSKDAIFGHRSYFAETAYHATAVALTRTELIIISREQCQEICESHPDLLKAMVKLIALELGEAELRLSGLQDKSANARITESMVFLKLKYPEQTWTRKEIAEHSGSTFETVTRVMTALAEKGLIEKSGRDYKIPDHEELLAFSANTF